MTTGAMAKVKTIAVIVGAAMSAATGAVVTKLSDAEGHATEKKAAVAVAAATAADLNALREHIDGRFERLNDKLDQKYEGLNGRVSKIEGRMEEK